MFKKGQSGNPKGRPVGAKDKLRGDLLRKFADILGTNMFSREAFEKDLAMMEPKDRFAARIKIIEFFVPKAVQQHEINVKKVGEVEKQINLLAGQTIKENDEEGDGDDNS